MAPPKVDAVYSVKPSVEGLEASVERYFAGAEVGLDGVGGFTGGQPAGRFATIALTIQVPARPAWVGADRVRVTAIGA